MGWGHFTAVRLMVPPDHCRFRYLRHTAPPEFNAYCDSATQVAWDIPFLGSPSRLSSAGTESRFLGIERILDPAIHLPTDPLLFEWLGLDATLDHHGRRRKLVYAHISSGARTSIANRGSGRKSSAISSRPPITSSTFSRYATPISNR